LFNLLLIDYLGSDFSLNFFLENGMLFSLIILLNLKKMQKHILATRKNTISRKIGEGQVNYSK